MLITIWFFIFEWIFIETNGHEIKSEYTPQNLIITSK